LVHSELFKLSANLKDLVVHHLDFLHVYGLEVCVYLSSLNVFTNSLFKVLLKLAAVDSSVGQEIITNTFFLIFIETSFKHSSVSFDLKSAHSLPDQLVVFADIHISVGVEYSSKTYGIVIFELSFIFLLSYIVCEDSKTMSLELTDFSNVRLSGAWVDKSANVGGKSILENALVDETISVVSNLSKPVQLVVLEGSLVYVVIRHE